MEEMSVRLRDLMDEYDLTAKDLGNKSNVEFRTIEGWLSSRKTNPRADLLYEVARALNTSVEFLIDGERGANYIRTIVENEGRIYRPPSRIAAIVDALNYLSDEKLDSVQTMVLALAGATSRERAEGS